MHKSLDVLLGIRSHLGGFFLENYNDEIGQERRNKFIEVDCEADSLDVLVVAIDDGNNIDDILSPIATLVDAVMFAGVADANADDKAGNVVVFLDDDDDDDDDDEDVDMSVDDNIVAFNVLQVFEGLRAV
ncbi:hypothetical protein GQX74_005144 [Glossina fuscipes]|nr:hypothetical protein GQX74_005144 [Glossina fuscipes]